MRQVADSTGVNDFISYIACLVKFRFTENLRLKAKDTSPESLHQMHVYNELILAIGEGKQDCPHAIVVQPADSQGIMSYKTSSLTYCNIADNVAIFNALESIFPPNLSDHSLSKRAILAATNKQVEKWNEAIQNRLETTESPISVLESKDELCEADDPHGLLHSMLTDDVLNNFNSDRVPPHQLRLRVGDICLLMRTIDRQEKLVNNCKIRVAEIKQFSIKAITLQHPRKVVIIPRIRFKFRLPYGQSFEMIRTQFPLRLAYSLTMNKSQGQELERALLDVTIPPFVHGHLYVALSRAKTAEGIAVIVSPNQITENAIILQNVLYPELLNDI